MIRRLIVILIAVCCTPGCASVSPRALTRTEDAPVMVSLNRGELEFNILPIGSYVSVQCEQGRKYQGIIVHRNPSRLELANCLRQSTVDGDDGQLQLTTQCVPLQVIEQPTVTNITIMSLPSPKFDPPEMKFEREGAEVAAIEFHSGRVQHWIEPQIEASLSRRDRSLEEMAQALEDVPAGSQIAFVDSSGERYNALVLSTTPQTVNLRCCVKKEAIQGRDGHDAFCLSLLPVCSFDIESISTLGVVASPPPDFDASEFDSGCDLCIADVIYKSGRRQSQWKLARDDARMSEFFDKKARPVMERNLAKLFD